jgi:PAS domain-containing protein
MRYLVKAQLIMRATLESTADAILVTDEKAKVLDFNERFIEIWKIPREALRSQTLGEV